MNTVTKYSVSDAAILYKKSRATLYKDIKNGTLSRDHDGFIDFSELLRVYGEPCDRKHKKRIDIPSIQKQNTNEYTDNTFLELKNQIDFLKKQLEKAEDRESKANARIDTLLTLIEMKPVQSYVTKSTDQKSESDMEYNHQEETLNSTKQTKSQHISVPDDTGSNTKRRGFFSRLFLPNG